MFGGSGLGGQFVGEGGRCFGVLVRGYFFGWLFGGSGLGGQFLGKGGRRHCFGLVGLALGPVGQFGRGLVDGFVARGRLLCGLG